MGACISSAEISSDFRCYSKVDGVLHKTSVKGIEMLTDTTKMTCDGSKNNNGKSEMYIGTNDVQISKILTVYNLKSSFVQTEDFTTNILGQNISTKIFTTEKYPIELHQYLHCYMAPNISQSLKIYPIISLGKEDEFNCSVPASDNHKTDGYSLLLLIGYYRVIDSTPKGANLFSVPAIIYVIRKI